MSIKIKAFLALGLICLALLFPSTAEAQTEIKPCNLGYLNCYLRDKGPGLWFVYIDFRNDLILNGLLKVEVYLGSNEKFSHKTAALYRYITFRANPNIKKNIRNALPVKRQDIYSRGLIHVFVRIWFRNAKDDSLVATRPINIGTIDTR